MADEAHPIIFGRFIKTSGDLLDGLMIGGNPCPDQAIGGRQAVDHIDPDPRACGIGPLRFIGLVQ